MRTSCLSADTPWRAGDQSLFFISKRRMESHSVNTFLRVSTEFGEKSEHVICRSGLAFLIWYSSPAPPTPTEKSDDMPHSLRIRDISSARRGIAPSCPSFFIFDSAALSNSSLLSAMEKCV